MNLSRREFIIYSSMAVLSVGANAGQAEIEIEAWKKACFSWMELLIPQEAIMSERLWSMMSEYFDSEPDSFTRLVAEFTSISKLRLPTTREEVNAILRLNSPKADFLRWFNNILIEIFYGSELGWQDLGFLTPPQPNGFWYT